MSDEIFDEPGKINHKIAGGTVFYLEEGIVFAPIFGFKKFKITWEEIDFLSLTPAVKKINNEWVDFQKKDLDDLGFLVVKVALKDRHEILKRVKLFSRLWLKLSLYCKPLIGADDKPLPQKGVITIDVKLKSLSVKRTAFVDFMSKKSRFDLLVSF